MKLLAFLALSVVATAAVSGDEIIINGDSLQAVALSTSFVVNSASANNKALQNLASNSGNVKLKWFGESNQFVVGTDSIVTNQASGQGAYANQNLSSNMGDVTIGGTSAQLTYLSYSGVMNAADGRNSVAVQNIASNNSCFGCLDRPR